MPFCGECGSDIGGKAFCGECGTKVGGAAPAAAASSGAALTSGPSISEVSGALGNSTDGIGKGGNLQFLGKANMVKAGTPSEATIMLDANAGRFIEGKEYRLKKANASVQKQIKGIWEEDKGVEKISDKGLTITGMWVNMAPGGVSEDFISHVSMGKANGTETTLQLFWCPNTEASLQKVLEGGFKDADSAQLSFAKDPMAAIKENVNGPRKVVIAKVALYKTNQIHGKVTVTDGRGALISHVVDYS